MKKRAPREREALLLARGYAAVMPSDTRFDKPGDSPTPDRGVTADDQPQPVLFPQLLHV